MPNKQEIADQLQRERDRGARARDVLANPMVAEALDAIELRCRERWEQSAMGDVDGREEAFKMLHIAKSFRRAFEDVVKTGKMAEMALEKDNG